ncbi:hypothetical protein [Coxiella burnetii]|nr:hypothetical protein [Coxiella burnetii]
MAVILILALRLLKARRPAVKPRDDDAKIRIAGLLDCYFYRN